MAERGIDVSYETIRCWTLKFGTLFARNLRRARSSPTGRWHLDEMVVRIGGQRMYLWRAAAFASNSHLHSHVTCETGEL